MINLEIYDSTLRDGIQGVGASLNHKRKVELFNELDEFGVHYIELGWPTRDKEDEFIRLFHECEKLQKRTNIVAFGSTALTSNPNEDPNYHSILKTRAKYVCLFGKSWIHHIKEQLKISPEENLNRIRDSIYFFREKGSEVFYDGEHYFDGYIDNSSYALETLATASNAGAERLILCDTNGKTAHRQLNPIKTPGIKEIVENTRIELDNLNIKTRLGVHLHNDRGQALDATLECLPYISQVQGTMHGRGERIGNLDLTAFIARYFLEFGDIPGIDLKDLRKISDISYILSGIPLPDPDNRFFVGDTAFAHKGGVHIDAMVKQASYEHAPPELFGNKRHYVLNTLGGRSGVIKNAEAFGYKLNKKDLEIKRRVEGLYNELQTLEYQGYRLGILEAEKFLLIEKYFGDLKQFFEVESWNINTGKEISGRRYSNADISLRVNKELVKEKIDLEGKHGPVDAIYKLFVKALVPHYPSLKNLELIGFDSKIAHQHGEESSMRTLVILRNSESSETVGVDNNIIGSAVKALEKGFKYHLQKEYKAN